MILQVVTKTQQMKIGKMEAMFEVYTDILVNKTKGSVDQALLWVLRQDFKEFCVSRVKHNATVNLLLHMQKLTNLC